MLKLIPWLWVLFLFQPVLAQEKGWEKQWNELIAGAKKEGKVVVFGSADPVVRKELPAAFQRKFGIPLEYLGGRGGDNMARLVAERQAGIDTVDAVFSGLSGQGSLYEEKMLAPIKPALILPEVLDPSKWKKGKPWFVDPEQQYVLRVYNYVTTSGLSINTELVKPEEFKSIKNLLDPKWRGKISVYDPTVSGSGTVEATRFYRQFGKEFVRKLYVDQKPAISRNKRQMSDWLARGQHPVTFAVEIEAVIGLKKDGFPVEVINVPDMPSTLSAGNGLLGMNNKAPHPNAARLFVNWIASKEGMEILGRGRNKPTTRTDIDDSYALPWEIPQPGVNYFDAYDWNFYLQEVPKMRELMKEFVQAR